jgi:hypothetical protein
MMNEPILITSSLSNNYPAHPKQQQYTGQDVSTETMILHDQLMQWDHAAQALLNTMEGGHDHQKLVLMRVHHRTMLTLLESSLGYGECHLDEFQWAFEDVVSFVTEVRDRSKPGSERSSKSDYDSSSDSESSFTFDSNQRRSLDMVRSRTSTPVPPIQHDTASKPTRPVFVLDAGIIFSLFWTAVKCRDGVIRRRAIALLEQSWQEGVWIGMVQAAIAKRIVEIEEDQPYEQYPDVGRTKMAANIRDEVRVHNVSSDVDKAGKRAKIVLLMRRNGWQDFPEDPLCESVEWVYW